MVMQRLHSLPQLAGVPVIMLSGRDPEKNRDGALAAGAVAYFAKPVDAGGADRRGHRARCWARPGS